MELLCPILEFPHDLVRLLQIQPWRLDPRRTQLIQQPIEVFRIANENLGVEGRCAADENKRLKRFRCIAQKAEKICAMGDVGKQPLEVIDGSVGVWRLAGCFQQSFHYASQDVS